MFKKLRWIIIIPGVLASFAQAQSTAAVSVADIVEKDLFQYHSPTEDLAQKDYQSAEYKVTYLTAPAPTKEEKDLLLDSASILSNRDWFLRRMDKNEEPAKQWLKDHGFIDKGKEEPSAEQKKKALDAQKARLKNAVIDYNKLVANMVEKRKIPAVGSVAVEPADKQCGKDTSIALTSDHTATPTVATTFTTPAISNLSNDFFGIAHRQNADDTRSASDRQVQMARHDNSYITPDNLFRFSTNTVSNSAIENTHTAATVLKLPLVQAPAALVPPARQPERSGPKSEIVAEIPTIKDCSDDVDCVRIDAMDTSKSLNFQDSRVHITGTAPFTNVWVNITVQSLDKPAEMGYVRLVKTDDKGHFDLNSYLTHGSGRYQVEISYNKQASGGMNITFKKFIVTNSDTADHTFSFPSGSVQSDDPQIIEQAKKIIAGAHTDLEKARAIHDFVSGQISYDYAYLTQGTPTGLTAIDVLNNKEGICYGYSLLYAALARAAGLPTKLVSGPVTWPDGTAWPAHEWNEVLVDGYWVTVDSTWDRQTNRVDDKYFDPSSALFSKDHFKKDTSAI